MKRWLKYGLWFVGAYLVISLIASLLPKLTSADYALIFGGIMIILSMPSIWILSIFIGPYDFLYQTTAPIMTAIIIISICIYFLIGALIGWIISKLRSKKENFPAKVNKINKKSKK